jgi:hypothetical protein
MPDTSIVKFNAETPTHVVRLRNDPRQGTRKKSIYKDADGQEKYDYEHRVNDGQLLYIDAQAHQDLIQSGANAGDYIRVSKCRRGKETYFEIALVSDAQETPTPEPTPTPTPIRPPQQATVRSSAPVAHYVATATAPQIQPLLRLRLLNFPCSIVPRPKLSLVRFAPPLTR